ncbi:MAG: hypothetical protein JSR17_10170 [Proteobacteria bacterium]|nr:hypothetical protein [Pseudomonadota bacterium]
MLLGVKESQEQISSALQEFAENFSTSKPRIPLDEAHQKQGQLIEKLDAIIRNCQSPSQLTFDTPFNLDSKPVPFSLFIHQFQLGMVIEWIKRAQAHYEFTYTAQPSVAVPLIEELPTQFFEQGENLQGKRGQLFAFKSKLGGRGQAEKAGFFEDATTHKQFLIKEDKPETCLLEGTAYFVKQANLLPQILAGAVNYATVAALATEKAVGKTVSVQERVTSPFPGGKVMPWDELVYGVKRNPNTIWSIESWYPAFVKRGVAELNSMPQWELAAALFASNIAGDESLHVGQFMALVDDHQRVLGIKRIDLGARERAAVAREKRSDLSPYHASTSYQGSIWKGKQMGKDYISFLLAEPGLERKYNLLWLMLANRRKEDELVENIVKQSKEVFMRQYDAVPEEHKDKVLENIAEIINSGADPESSFKFQPGANREAKLQSLAIFLAMRDAKRFIAMKEEVVLSNNREMALFEKQLQIKIEPKHHEMCLNILRKREQLLKGVAFDEKEIPVLYGQLDGVLKELLTKAIASPKVELIYEQIQMYSRSALELLDTQCLLLLDDKSKQAELRALEGQIKKYQSLMQCASYCLGTKSKDKLPYIVALMNDLLGNPEAQFCANLAKNTNLIATLCTQTGMLSRAAEMVAVQRSEGYYLLRNLFRRYGMDESHLALTPEQRWLKDSIAAKEFSNVKNTIGAASFNVNDALAPNFDGTTALHLLMRDADNKEAYEAIALILQKSLGYKNTSVDIKDVNGQTPLDYLSMNPHAAECLAYIDKAYQGKSWTGGAAEYRLADLFDKTKLQATVEAIRKSSEKKLTH